MKRPGLIPLFILFVLTAGCNNNDGSAKMWDMTCGLAPHTPDTITINGNTTTLTTSTSMTLSTPVPIDTQIPISISRGPEPSSGIFACEQGQFTGSSGSVSGPNGFNSTFGDLTCFTMNFSTAGTYQLNFTMPLACVTAQFNLSLTFTVQ